MKLSKLFLENSSNELIKTQVFHFSTANINDSLRGYLQFKNINKYGTIADEII